MKTAVAVGVVAFGLPMLAWQLGAVDEAEAVVVPMTAKAPGRGGENPDRASTAERLLPGRRRRSRL